MSFISRHPYTLSRHSRGVRPVASLKWFAKCCGVAKPTSAATAATVLPSPSLAGQSATLSWAANHFARAGPPLPLEASWPQPIESKIAFFFDGHTL